LFDNAAATPQAFEQQHGREPKSPDDDMGPVLHGMHAILRGGFAFHAGDAPRV
jgi:hypothetical protein